VSEKVIVRVSALEDSILEQSEICESVTCQLRTLSQEVRDARNEMEARLDASSAEAEPTMTRLIVDLRSELREDIRRLESETADSLQDVRTSIRWLSPEEFPLGKAKSLDGIIAHLTKKHGGNVHEMGVVTLASRTVSFSPLEGLKNIADLTTEAHFASRNEPGQWICWDFGDMRVRPTHYTLSGWDKKSWLVEGSMDGHNWTVIDEKTHNEDFRRSTFFVRRDQREGMTASLAVPRIVDCRFILTGTGKDHTNDDGVSLRAVEFFFLLE
jgi:hypothetical protein